MATDLAARPTEPVTAPVIEIDAGAASGVEARAVAALLACVARTGWTKTTFDDVAREAGCSRATLYRYFTGKTALAAATVAAERARVQRALVAATEHATSLEDALVAVLTTGTRMLQGHAALEFLLAFEPEVILPHLTFSAGDDLLVESGRVVGPAIAPFLDARHDPARIGEWVARTAFVYLDRPNAPFDLASEADVRVLVRAFLLPTISEPTISEAVHHP